jgi:D-glycero-alpha-D-manno-heptose 1-phosphate guanylyltransferase
MYFFRRDALARFPHCRPGSFELDVFPHLVSIGETIQVYRVEDPFIDIGTPESLAGAGRFIEEHLAPAMSY